MKEIEVIYAPDYKICCDQVRGMTVSASVCLAEKDPLSTCEDLIGNTFLKIAAIVITIVGFIGNLLSFVYIISNFKGNPNELLILMLNISDSLYIIYLIIIVGFTYYFEDDYVWFEKEWRTGKVCQFLGVLSTQSTIATPFFIVFITGDRFLILKKPLMHVSKKHYYKYICGLIWVISLATAVLPVLPAFQVISLYS